MKRPTRETVVYTTCQICVGVGAFVVMPDGPLWRMWCAYLLAQFAGWVGNVPKRRRLRESDARRKAEVLGNLRLWADATLAAAKLKAANARVEHQGMTWNEACAWVDQHFTTRNGRGPLPDKEAQS